MQRTDSTDVIVIGGGIAGTSVAAELADGSGNRPALRVVVLERESRLGYHTTGRSAAIYAPSYGPTTVRALTRASRAAFSMPAPDGTPLTLPRSALFIARADQADAVETLRGEIGDTLQLITGAQARDLCPLLRETYVDQALLDPGTEEIEVALLHETFQRRIRAGGGEIVPDTGVTDIAKAGQDWRVETPKGTFTAPVVVNAAGAWADEIAKLAGVKPVGLQPKRRTALIVDCPEGVSAERWPMVISVDEQFYLKPEAGQLLISPADTTPSPPCDAQPEELDIAICVDRIETAFDISVRRIAHKWAGLRSFVADGEPVAGYAADAPGFFWLAGQGGYGIQTAPALGRTAAALVCREQIPDDITAAGVAASALSPARPGLG